MMANFISLDLELAVKNIVTLCMFAFILTGCGQKYEAAKFVGGSFRYMYHDDAVLSNQSIAVIKDVPEFKDKKNLEAVEAFNAKYRQLSITQQVGAFIADTMQERYKLKRFSPDLESSRTDFINGKMEKESEAGYWLIVNTPIWRFKPSSLWNKKVTMQYVIQYRLVDVKTQQLLVGNSCVYNSESSELADYAKNNFEQMSKDMNSAIGYCKTQLSENIDPNRVGRVTSRPIY